MPKITARNAEVIAKGIDISARSNAVTLSMTAEAPDVTAFKSTVRERLANGLKDAEFGGNAFFDTAASNVDELFNSLLTGSAIYGFYPRSASSGRVGYEFSGIMTEYSSDFGVPDAAAATFTVSGCGDVVRGKALGYKTISGDTSSSGYLDSGCSVDFTGSTANAGKAVWRVLNIAGTSACISASYQHSGDDTSFTTLIDFSNLALPNSVLDDTYSSASQYRRIKYEITATGSFSATIQGFSGSRIGY